MEKELLINIKICIHSRAHLMGIMTFWSSHHVAGIILVGLRVLDVSLVHLTLHDECLLAWFQEAGHYVQLLVQLHFVFHHALVSSLLRECQRGLLTTNCFLWLLFFFCSGRGWGSALFLLTHDRIVITDLILRPNAVWFWSRAKVTLRIRRC